MLLTELLDLYNDKITIYLVSLESSPPPPLLFRLFLFPFTFHIFSKFYRLKESNNKRIFISKEKGINLITLPKIPYAHLLGTVTVTRYLTTKVTTDRADQKPSSAVFSGFYTIHSLPYIILPEYFSFQSTTHTTSDFQNPFPQKKPLSFHNCNIPREFTIKKKQGTRLRLVGKKISNKQPNHASEIHTRIVSSQPNYLPHLP